MKNGAPNECGDHSDRCFRRFLQHAPRNVDEDQERRADDEAEGKHPAVGRAGQQAHGVRNDHTDEPDESADADYGGCAHRCGDHDDDPNSGDIGTQ